MMRLFYQTENKADLCLEPVHEALLLNHMKAAGQYPLGLLVVMEMNQHLNGSFIMGSNSSLLRCVDLWLTNYKEFY
jgi:hypothetical protein